jgi:hypothetical protein
LTDQSKARAGVAAPGYNDNEIVAKQYDVDRYWYTLLSCAATAWSKILAAISAVLSVRAIGSAGQQSF